MSSRDRGLGLQTGLGAKNHVSFWSSSSSSSHDLI